MNWLKTGWFLVMAFLAIPLSGVAAGETQPPESVTRYALLVGVSQYPSGVPSLQGPRNDVSLIRDILLERKFAADHIQILADGVESAAGLPTHAAIMNALQGLTQRVRPGDFVYLHFSGHGSRQPVVQDAAEPDGLDEIFLPHDIGQWDGGNHAVQNALVDNDIGKMINRLRERGAFVWAIFDACHSATLTRSGDVIARNVDPGNLGIPQDAFKALPVSRGGSDAQASGFQKSLAAAQGSGMGGYVAFFGARPDQIAPEMKLPRNSANSQPYGLLTFTLASVLTQSPGITYRQLNESLLREYSVMFVTSSTPLAEGSNLDAPVFGQEVQPPIRQWPIRRAAQGDVLSLPAGRLHGLDVGAVLAIVEKPGDPDNAAKGYLKVRTANTFESGVEPYSPDRSKSPLPVNDLPANAYARLITGEPRLNLRVALPLGRPVDKNQRYSGREQAALTAIKALVKPASPKTAPAIEWVGRERDPDVVLHLADGKLWLLDSVGAWPPTQGMVPPAIALGDDKADLQKKLLSHLSRLVKAVNLGRIVSEMNSGGGDRNLEIRLDYKPGGQGDYQSLARGNLHTLRPGDQLKITWKNVSKDFQDVTLLLIDSRYGITPISPDFNRLAPGTEDFREGSMTADPLGIERLIVVAVKSEKDAPLSNFGYLAQEALPPEVQAKGGDGTATRGSAKYETLAFEDRLIAAGFGQEKTRGFEASEKSGVASMDLLQWRVSQ